MERNIPGLLVLCDNLVTLEALVYEAGCDLTLTLKELQQMKDIEKLRLLMNSVGFIFNFKHSLCTLTKVCLRTKYEMSSKPEKLVITESFLIKKKIILMAHLSKASRTVVAVFVPRLLFVHTHPCITSFFSSAGHISNLGSHPNDHVSSLSPF